MSNYKRINLRYLKIVRDNMTPIPVPERYETVKMHSQFVKKLDNGKEERGPPLIFLHGMLGSSYTFKFYAQNDKIQKHKSSILLDLRNHGLSGNSASMGYFNMAQDLNRFLIESEISEPVTLIGHSLGAKMAMQFSLLYPDKVHAVCSMDSPPVNRNNFPKMNEYILSIMK